MHKFLRNQEQESFLDYLEASEKRDPINLRDLFKFKDGIQPISIDDVEPVENIRIALPLLR